MRLFYVGNLGPDAAPHSTENDVRVAFEALGWDVDGMPERDFMRALDSPRLRPALWDRALSADLVIHTMTQGRYPNADECLRLWADCERAGVPTASIHLDLFFGLSSPKDSGPQRCALPREHPMFKVAHVFTADGGHDEEWKRDGVNHHWLPPGVRHTECIDVGPNDRFQRPSDPVTLTAIDAAAEGRYLVGFAGSDGYHPEWPHRPQLVQWLREQYGDKFLHIGGSSTPRITGLALNRVLASVPVWVGDSCLTRPDFAYWSDRLPETWGRGGFLIHPRIDAMSEHYMRSVPGKPWECGDWNALRGEIEDWLGADDLRGSCRESMAAFTRVNDTYLNRAQTMLDVIGFDCEALE